MTQQQHPIASRREAGWGMGVSDMIWIGVGALFMVAAGILLAVAGLSARWAGMSGLLVVTGAFVAMTYGSLPDFRPGDHLGVYHLFVGDILLVALVGSYHGSRPPRRW